MEELGTLDDLLYGKYKKERIVSYSLSDKGAELFIQNEDDTIRSEIKPLKYWLTSFKPLDPFFERLKGNLYYKYIRKYDTKEEYMKGAKSFYNDDVSRIYDDKQAAQILYGFTLYKGLKVEDVSVLSFDIETDGLTHHKDSIVYLISSTYRDKKGTENVLFDFKEHESTGSMIEAWTAWVRSKNPSILLGHNIIGYDLPYLKHVASLEDKKVELGRDGSDIIIDSYEAKFRKDGAQSISYHDIHVYGREVVDTLFLSYKYDIGRKYESNGLKQIIKQEKMEDPNRVFYDASQIRFNVDNPVEWIKIKDYCCFAPNSALVSLENGSVKYIEDMNIGDAVISHDGSVQYVYEKLERNYSDKILSFQLEGGRKIHNVTLEHPFYVLNEDTLQYEWIKAKDLKINHLLVKGSKNTPKHGLSYKEDDFWLFGLYIGDGYVRLQKTLKYPVFTQHRNEVQNLINVLEKNGYKFSIVESKTRENKAVQVVVFSNELGNKFLNWSGGNFKSKDKRISKEFFDILNGSKKLFLNFLGGLLDADGHLRLLKTSGYQAKLGLITPHIINSIDLLCCTHGLNPTRSNMRMTQTNSFSKKSKPFYQLTFFTESILKINEFLKNKKRTDLVRESDEILKKHVRIVKIEKNNYEGIVYNISVTNQNSYIVNGIITHNCHDSGDALKLYDLMIPSFFYMTQNLTCGLQNTINKASGSLINNLMIRSYIQQGHSIPKPNKVEKLRGGISFGIPGIYKNCWKVDIKSCYPSAILINNLYSRIKDPFGHMYKLCKYFTYKRFEYKKQYKETGNILYQGLDASAKIFINSMFGFCSTSGLHFNDPGVAADITKFGRKYLSDGMIWGTGQDSEYWIAKADPEEENEELS